VARRVINRVLCDKRPGGNGYERRARRNATLSRLFCDVVKYLTYFITTFAVLSLYFNITLASFLTFAGLGSIAIGFGAQNLIRDFISGFFILLDEQLGVGDTVTIGANTGVVEDVGLRATRVRGENGALIIVPNGTLAVIINHSK
jgi:small conductance mechanosensitive channel